MRPGGTLPRDRGQLQHRVRNESWSGHDRRAHRTELLAVKAPSVDRFLRFGVKEHFCPGHDQHGSRQPNCWPPSVERELSGLHHDRSESTSLSDRRHVALENGHRYKWFR